MKSPYDDPILLENNDKQMTFSYCWICGGAAALEDQSRRARIAVAYGSEPTTCSVRALRAWLAAAGLVDGPLFVGLTPRDRLRSAPLGDRMVAHVVKRRCKAVGINPAQVTGRSLRRGFATAATREKKPDRLQAP